MEYSERQLIAAIAGGFALILIATNIISRKDPEHARLERNIAHQLEESIAARGFAVSSRGLMRRALVSECAIEVRIRRRAECGAERDLRAMEQKIFLGQIKSIRFTPPSSIPAPQPAAIAFELDPKIPGLPARHGSPDGFNVSFVKLSHCNGKTASYPSSDGKNINLYLQGNDRGRLRALYDNIAQYMELCRRERKGR